MTPQLAEKIARAEKRIAELELLVKAWKDQAKNT
tara:strand:- start:28 stop:129 length:102 start_codon:yes stop_codon:yes gene_type:complete